jgi:hypothetical protein
VTAERAKMAGDDATQLEDAIIESIALQAEAAGFSLNRS